MLNCLKRILGTLFVLRVLYYVNFFGDPNFVLSEKIMVI